MTPTAAGPATRRMPNSLSAAQPAGGPWSTLTTVMYLPHHPQTSVVPREDAHYYRCPDHGRFSFTKAEGLKPEPT